MAVNVTVYDLDNYPDNNKTITVNQNTIVPVGYEGDEQWVISFTTSAYSNNANRTPIQDIYVREMKAGWIKSSGFTGAAGKFTLESGTSNKLKIKIDASAGQAGEDGYYVIELDHGINLSGEVIAADIESKIRNLPNSVNWNESDSGYVLAYKNAVVDYTNGRFRIVSGSVGKYYTGSYRSSVSVAKADGDTCYEILGFDLAIDSQTIAGQSIKEAVLLEEYTADSATMTIGDGTGAVAGDCAMITDGVSTDYFQIIDVSGSVLTVPVSGTNGFTGVTNNYDAHVSKVQILREQDPDQEPVSYYDTVDSITRWGIETLINSIDFSS